MKYLLAQVEGDHAVVLSMKDQHWTRDVVHTDTHKAEMRVSVKVLSHPLRDECSSHRNPPEGGGRQVTYFSSLQKRMLLAVMESRKNQSKPGR